MTPLRRALTVACAAWLWAGCGHAQEMLRLGAAAVTLAPRGSDAAPPPAPWRTPAMQGRAAPTNQWFSTLVFNAEPEPIYALPLTLRPTRDGLEVALPQRQVVPTERRDVEIHHSHSEPVRIRPVAFAPWPARLAGQGDFSVEMALGDAPAVMQATTAHGSPYVWLQWPQGELSVQLPASAQRLPAPADDPRVLVLRSAGRDLVLAGPSGVVWRQHSEREWRALPAAGQPAHLAVSFAPDAQPSTLALLVRHAYARISDSRVSWRYERERSEVATRHQVSTQLLEGTDHGPLLGLYPHHWHQNSTVADRLGPAYDTVRGPVRLLAASQFDTLRPYHGFVPFWPAVSGPREPELRELMRTDLRNARRMMLEIGNGPYWQGKGLQRIAKLLDVVEQQGDAEGRAQLLALLNKRIASWFSGEERKTYFHLDRRLGTLLGYPEEYFAVVQMNDHHFHYGYWIRTLAELALRDPSLAGPQRWGPMVDLMVADIATAERGRADFPFLRNFDPYEGHSWASGIGMGPHGNNQESSSEAVNAWVGLILWGELTGNTALRDLGIYLYSTEVAAIEHYWFDVHQLVLPPAYRHVEVSMLFGGKIAHNTWWTDEPRQIKGINLLPLTTASTYLGAHPAYVRRNLATLEADTAVYAQRGKRADPPDIWQDIFAKYLALADPQAALPQWQRWGAVELGDSRSHSLHWLLSLHALGTPDFSVRANTPLYAVFRQPDGRRTHLAYNASAQPLTVKFSDGVQLEVPPRQLVRQPSGP